MEGIRTLWSNGGYQVPDINVAYNEEGELFLVLSDNTTIIRLMNIKGKIYAVAKFRCQTDDAKTYYLCGKPMHIISCTTYTNEKDKYSFETVLPYVIELANKSR